ncbi:biliverdin-producing heme oxygenase [Methylobacterium sp. JK268]
MTDPAPDALLSLRLRAETQGAHARVEALSGLPGTIRSRADYAACLAALLSVWGPIEGDLARWPDWTALGLDPLARARGPLLAADLADLAAGPAPAVALAPSTAFAEALGRLYVLEGSALGGKLILADLRARSDLDLGAATRFFGGHGRAAGRLWAELRAALDAFGARHPEEAAAVIRGAQDAFAAFAAAFRAADLAGRRAA